MDRANQPAKLHFSNDELHALKSILGAGTVVKQQQNSSNHLDHKQKKRHATEVIPDRMTVDRHLFLLRHSGDSADRQALVQPVLHHFCSHKFYALLTTISSPRVFTLNSSSGRGGGPATFLPLRL